MLNHLQSRDRKRADIMHMTEKKILVVDDATNIRRSFCQMLEFSGYRTAEASNGEDAIKAVEQEEVDLILMDVVMPGMSGIEATRRIRSQHTSSHVILMSGYIGRQELKDLPNGVRTVLGKPIEAEELLAAVQRKLSIGAQGSEVRE